MPPYGYLKASRLRGESLAALFAELGVQSDDSILELGCNCGRNLMQLWDAGYRDLTGVEINQLATDCFEANRGDRQIAVCQTAIEHYVRTMDAQFDVVYTMAVLFHLHPDSAWVFQRITKLVGKYLVVVEQEASNKPPRHYQRNYRDIFTRAGMHEIVHRSGFGDLDGRYQLRVFQHEASQ